MRIAVITATGREPGTWPDEDVVHVPLGAAPPGDSEALAALLEEAEAAIERAGADAVAIAASGPTALAAAVTSAKLQLPAVRIRHGDEPEDPDTTLAERIAVPVDAGEAAAALQRLGGGLNGRVQP